MLASSYLVEEGETFQSLNENQPVWFHRLGTPQSDDVLIHATPNKPELNHTAQVTDDGRYLPVSLSAGTEDRYALTSYDLGKPGSTTTHKSFDSYERGSIGVNLRCRR